MGVGLTCAGIFHHEVQRLLRLYHLKELYWEGEEEQAGLGESGRAAILPPQDPTATCQSSHTFPRNPQGSLLVARFSMLFSLPFSTRQFQLDEAGICAYVASNQQLSSKYRSVPPPGELKCVHLCLMTLYTAVHIKPNAVCESSAVITTLIQIHTPEDKTQAQRS